MDRPKEEEEEEEEEEEVERGVAFLARVTSIRNGTRKLRETVGFSLRIPVLADFHFRHQINCQ